MRHPPMSPYNCYAGNGEAKASGGGGKFWGGFQSGKRQRSAVSYKLLGPLAQNFGDECCDRVFHACDTQRSTKVFQVFKSNALSRSSDRVRSCCAGECRDVTNLSKIPGYLGQA